MSATLAYTVWDVFCDCPGCRACVRLAIAQRCTASTVMEDGDDSDGWTLDGDPFEWDTSEYHEATGFLCPACSMAASGEAQR